MQTISYFQFTIMVQVILTVFVLGVFVASSTHNSIAAATGIVIKTWCWLSLLNFGLYVMLSTLTKEEITYVLRAAEVLFYTLIGLVILITVFGLVIRAPFWSVAFEHVGEKFGSRGFPHAIQVVSSSSKPSPILMPRETFGGMGKERPFSMVDPDVEVIRIYGDISSELSEILQQRVRDAAMGSRTKVRIELRSCGGDSDDGFYLRRLLIDLQQIKQVEVLVTGTCASAAILLLLAVPIENRFSMARARFMVHSARRLHDMSLAHDVNHVMTPIYLDNTNVEQTSLEQLFASGVDYDFNASRALELGFVGTIISN
ncbi:MAG: ATP-dependent Clp protease proteolytic subunit [Candidatus Saccharimonas sp.]|nr:ATP-dependent Clp protease proteolytic subunit [Candidatus Saccharimonas sp.]